MRRLVTAAAVTVAALGTSGCTIQEAVHAWLADRGATGGQVAQFDHVIRCESDWDPASDNGHDAGLTQVNVGDAHGVGRGDVETLADLHDPGKALDVAWRMVFGWTDEAGSWHAGHGWRAWAPACRP